MGLRQYGHVGVVRGGGVSHRLCASVDMEGRGRRSRKCWRRRRPDWARGKGNTEASQIGFDLESSLVQGGERRVSLFEQGVARLHRLSELLGFGQKLLTKGVSPVMGIGLDFEKLKLIGVRGLRVVGEPAQAFLRPLEQGHRVYGTKARNFEHGGARYVGGGLDAVGCERRELGGTHAGYLVIANAELLEKLGALQRFAFVLVALDALGLLGGKALIGSSFLDKRGFEAFDFLQSQPAFPPVERFIPFLFDGKKALPVDRREIAFGVRE